MYVIPLIVLALLIAGLGLWAPPLFALLVALPAIVLFFAYVGTQRRPDEVEAEAVSGEPADAPKQERAPARGGIWGEREGA
ncbi:MAG TPA: hypothetical protein VKA89_08815 [Solirubrobacterales bacterium]|nr:hypothetical protein [Solirubrobacterales bacterium]